MLFSNSSKRGDVGPVLVLSLLALFPPVIEVRGRVLGLSEPSVIGERPCLDLGVGIRLGRGDPAGEAAFTGVALAGVPLLGVALGADCVAVLAIFFVSLGATSFLGEDT